MKLDQDQDRRIRRKPAKDARAEPRSTSVPGIGPGGGTADEIGGILSKLMFCVG